MKTKVVIYSKRAFPQEILDELEKLSEISKTEALERALNYLLRELPVKNRSLWAKISYEIELTKFMQSKVFARAGVFAWTLRPRDFKALEAIYSLPSVKRLGDIAEIKEGDTTRQEEKKVEEKNLSEVVVDDYYRVIRGRNVKPYCIIWEGSYLKKEYARKIDEKRLKRRILVRDVAPCIIAAVPDTAYRCLRTVYCIELKKRESEKPEIVEVFNKWLNDEEKAWAVVLHYLAGLLNSKLINALYYALFYMSQMSPREGNFRFRSQFLQPLPIVVPKSKGELEKCCKIAEKCMNMTTISKRIHELLDRVNEFPDPYVKELSSRDIGLLRDHVVIRKSSKAFRTGCIKLQETVDGKTALTSGKDVIICKGRVHAEIVERVLMRRFRGKKVEWSKLLKVEVPVDEAASRKILERYRKDLEELKALTKRYRDIQARIDALVNDLFKAPRIDQEYYLHYLGEKERMELTSGLSGE